MPTNKQNKIIQSDILIVAQRSFIRLKVDVIKHSTVSTAYLKAFRPLQLLPINLVVFQGSLVQMYMQS